jgi:cell filamentation protein
MPPDGDPYLYPGTTTLKNKLGLRDPAALERAQDERAAARYAILERNLPQPPFTFDTLKDVHKQLFGSVYDWAGQPRTIGIQKADWNDAGAKLTTFANPAMIAPMAGVAFKAIDNGRALIDLDRQAFAARAAEFLNDLNIIHPFREGNGRAQRILLSAIGEAAGHPIAFDVATRERMVATSIAAANGDLGGFTRLITEATDPRRVEAMRGALGFLQKAFPSWNDTYIATTTAGQRYDGTLVDRTKTDFMMRVSAPSGGWIAIGDAADLPRDALSGKPLTFTAARFAPDAPAAPSTRPDPPGGRPGPSAGM